VSKLAVRGSSKNKVIIGLFQRGTHAIATDASASAAHHPSINLAISTVQRLARKLHVTAYNESTGKGYFRNLAINVERSTGAVQMTLIWNAAGPRNNGEDGTGGNSSNCSNNDEAAVLLKKLTQALIAEGTASSPPKTKKDKKKRHKNKGNTTSKTATAPAAVFLLHSLWVHYNSAWKHDNAIISRTGEWEKMYGPDTLTEYLQQQEPLTDDGKASPATAAQRCRSPLYRKSFDKPTWMRLLLL